MSYTRDLTWQFDRRWGRVAASAQVELSDRRVPLEVALDDGAWWMAVDGGPHVLIPGGRDWSVIAWTAGRRKSRERYGHSWVVIPREVARGLETLQDWCKSNAERSITAEGYWIAVGRWSERREDPLGLPWIPEFDASRAELRRVACAEREHRELVEIITSIAEERRDAIVDATARGRSRREIADMAGLSVARIQQIVKGL